MAAKSLVIATCVNVIKRDVLHLYAIKFLCSWEKNSTTYLVASAYDFFVQWTKQNNLLAAFANLYTRSLTDFCKTASWCSMYIQLSYWSFVMFTFNQQSIRHFKYGIRSSKFNGNSLLNTFSESSYTANFVHETIELKFKYDLY